MSIVLQLSVQLFKTATATGLEETSTGLESAQKYQFEGEFVGSLSVFQTREISFRNVC